jgi:hypothetical protein
MMDAQLCQLQLHAVLGDRITVDVDRFNPVNEVVRIGAILPYAKASVQPQPTGGAWRRG